MGVLYMVFKWPMATWGYNTCNHEREEILSLSVAMEITANDFNWISLLIDKDS